MRITLQSGVAGRRTFVGMVEHFAQMAARQPDALAWPAVAPA